MVGNMERAVEFTERRIGQLEASVKFKSETVQSLKQKRADVMASMQKHEGIIRKLTATRAQLEQEARIAQDEVAVCCFVQLFAFVRLFFGSRD